MSETATSDLAQRASFIFAGTVTGPGRSALKVLAPYPGLAVVRFERGFRVNPVLGKLDGRPITVRLAQQGAGAGAVRSGQKLLFFATAWVHGEEIAVSEIARLPADVKTEEEVARIMASLPARHLADRIATAVLILQGVVGKVERAAEVAEYITEHAAKWMRASIEASEILKGALPTPAAPAPARGPRRSAAKGTVVLFFPSSGARAYVNFPRPQSGQHGVFLLHAGQPPLPEGALIAPDLADIQPDSQLATIRRLLGRGPTPPR